MTDHPSAMTHSSSAIADYRSDSGRDRIRSADWPRCYVQRVATGEIFEVCRGRDAESYTMLDHLQPSLVRGWVSWIEHPVRACVRIGGVVPRGLTPAA